MKSRALVVWVIVMLLFGMAIGAQAESAEDEIFFFDTATEAQAENAEDTIFSSGDWRYRVRSDGSLEIVEWNGDKSELIIPETIDGKKVAAIGDGAFYAPYYDHYGLTSVTIPDSVTSIGDNAFYYCDSLTSITLLDSVTSIGDYTFSYCNSLTSITIPDSVTSIGDDAFYCCESLISITIPDSVISIGDYAFGLCDSLTSITIPSSVTSIGKDAFSGCPDTLQLTVDRDSYAKEYARENNLSYNYPDALDWLNQ